MTQVRFNITFLNLVSNVSMELNNRGAVPPLEFQRYNQIAGMRSFAFLIEFIHESHALNMDIDILTCLAAQELGYDTILQSNAW